MTTLSPVCAFSLGLNVADCTSDPVMLIPIIVFTKRKKKKISTKAAALIKEYSLQHRHSEPSREANASCKLRVRITRPVLIKTWLARDVSRPASGHLILLVDETNRFELAKCISPKARVQQHGHHNGRWCEVSASHVVTQCVLRRKKKRRNTHAQVAAIHWCSQ